MYVPGAVPGAAPWCGTLLASLANLPDTIWPSGHMKRFMTKVRCGGVKPGTPRTAPGTMPRNAPSHSAQWPENNHRQQPKTKNCNHCQPLPTINNHKNQQKDTKGLNNTNKYRERKLKGQQTKTTRTRTAVAVSNHLEKGGCQRELAKALLPSQAFQEKQVQCLALRQEQQ